MIFGVTAAKLSRRLASMGTALLWETVVAREQVSCSKAAGGRLDIGNRALSNPDHRTIRQDIQAKNRRMR